MAGLLDRLKGLVKEREGQIKSAVDKAGGFVDDKTKGKYHDKIAKAGEKAEQVIDKVKADGADAAPKAADTAAPAASATPATDAPAAPVADATSSATDSVTDSATDSAEATDKPDEAATDTTDKPSA